MLILVMISVPLASCIYNSISTSYMACQISKAKNNGKCPQCIPGLSCIKH